MPRGFTLPPLGAPLTPREREVLAEMASGAPDPEIADRLFVSVRTVQWTARNLYAKLGAKNRVQVLLAARREGLVEL